MSEARIYATLASMVDRLAGSALAGTDVIRWSSPVPVFGNLSISRIATLGLNPSNLEFVDEEGHELDGHARRFHTLGSLGIKGWEQADVRHLRLVLQSCSHYFQRNPYYRWFGRLDQLLAKTGASYYSDVESRSDGRKTAACHLDLIPYATRSKWIALQPQQRLRLLERSGDALVALLRDSPITILVVNGQSVVSHFENLIGTRLTREERPEWALPRQDGNSVRGISYSGVIHTIRGVELGRELLVVGYNHNLQSSFGVTNGVMNRIANWLGNFAKDRRL
jgi:hypothetical protein